MADLILTGKDTTEKESKRIDVQDKDGHLLATIYADSSTIFHTRCEIYPRELNAISIVKDNFFLFWDNIKKEMP